ncbi:MAG: SPOR domain-containing protein [gamma proteobacterium endosymbiont of Lamellibrachia anaximandri]|nr:SPOR domain-containing protein [gamma proteobacterium endosymbiont of Lamellibrachia anaximandri]
MANSDNYFSTLELAQRQDLIRHLIENSEVVPLVRGPGGIGKSAMAAQLQLHAPDSWVVCHFDADPTLQPELLLAHIARGFGLADEHPGLMDLLVDHFGHLHQQGRVPVVLLDDVQLLPPASLIALLRLFEHQVEGISQVSIVLFANTQIDLLLATPQLQAMSHHALHVIDMPVLGFDAAKAFMGYLIGAEGLPETLALDDGLLGRIHRETQGRIGPLGESILEAIGTRPVRSGGAKTGRFTFRWLLIAVSALIVGGVLWFQDEINRLFVTGKSAPPEIEVRQQIPSMPQEVLTLDRRAIEPVQEKAPVVEVIQEADSASAEDQYLAEIEVTESIEVPVEMEQGAGTIDEAPLPEESAPSTELQPVGTGKPLVEPAAVSESEEDVPEVAQIEAVPELIEEPVIEQEALPEKARLPEVVPEPQVPADPLDKNNWLLEQNPEHYTLQLIGVEQLASLRRFVARHGLEKQAGYIRTKRKGKAWYVLLWGVYPERDAAQKAKRKLPRSLKGRDAWARTVGSLQQELNASFQ